VRGINVIALNADQAFATELRSNLLSIEGVKIVGEIDDVSAIEKLLEETSAEVVVINLDAGIEGLLPRIKRIAYQHSDVAFFAVSQSNDSQRILEAMRAGVREYLQRPIDRQQFSNIFSEIAKLKPTHTRHGKLICVVGSTGGTGETTLATNLAFELNAQSKRGAVIVDLCPFFGHVAMFLNTSAQFSMADLCRTHDVLDQNIVRKALVRHDSGVHLLVSANQPRSPRMDFGKCSAVLNLLTEMFDYVVCDGPPRNEAQAGAVWKMADSVLAVIHFQVPSVRNAAWFIQQLEVEGFNLDRLRLIVNRYEKDKVLLKTGDVEETLGKEIFWTLPNDWNVVSNAINLGQPLACVARKSKLAESIHQLAQELNRESQDSQAENSGNNGNEKIGLFARMFGRSGNT
jgi:pilus assembly protein CpaE